MELDRRRVLVVEDEYLTALSTMDALEANGCDIVGPAAHLGSALHSARTEALDGAVLDVNVGGQMIWPVAEELQRREVPFLFLTAYAADIIPSRFTHAPCLAKPLQQTFFRCQLDLMWSVHSAACAVRAPNC